MVLSKGIDMLHYLTPGSLKSTTPNVVCNNGLIVKDIGFRHPCNREINRYFCSWELEVSCPNSLLVRGGLGDTTANGGRSQYRFSSGTGTHI